MMEALSGVGEGVVAVCARGKVTARDYREVLEPLVESATHSGRRARLLYVLAPEFEGFELGALVEDAKVGLGHVTDFERIAVVTDRDWIVRSLHATAFMIPARVRLFAPDQIEQAKRWIAEPSPRALTIESELTGGTALVRVTLRGALDQSLERELVESVTRSVERAEKLRVLLRADDFHGWSDVRALWMHIKFVAGVRRKIEKVAVVGHASWQKRLIGTARAAFDLPARFFEEEAAAEAWIHEA